MNKNETPTRFAHDSLSLPLLSADYLIAALPLLIWSTYLNGARTLVLALGSILCAVIWEAILEGALRQRVTVWDTSAALDGLLFALMLPVTAPLWILPFGTLAAILLFKVLWGGQGKCPVHPAIGAYALLFPFFRTVLTSYAAPLERLPAFSAQPTGSVNQTILDQLAAGIFPTDQMMEEMLIGNLPGNMGQLSLLLLAGALVYLWQRGHARIGQVLFTLIPAFVTVLLLPATAQASDTMAINYAALQLGTGSLLFLTVFPASHPAYAPRTVRGQLIFGIGVGLLTGLIRYFGILADGAVYAVLVMQVLTPALNRAFRQRHYGEN